MPVIKYLIFLSDTDQPVKFLYTLFKHELASANSVDVGSDLYLIAHSTNLMSYTRNNFDFTYIEY